LGNHYNQRLIGASDADNMQIHRFRWDAVIDTLKEFGCTYQGVFNQVDNMENLNFHSFSCVIAFLLKFAAFEEIKQTKRDYCFLCGI